MSEITCKKIWHIKTVFKFQLYLHHKHYAMEEEEKLTEAELREDAESYMNKLRLRSEFAIIIGVPLLLLLCFAEYNFNRDLMVMVLYVVLCAILALSNIVRCKSIKSIDFYEFSLQEIAVRMKTMKKRQTILLYAILGCVLVWIAVLPFVNWGFVLKSFVIGVLFALIVFVAYKHFLSSSNGADNDYDDMISQLENFQQTDL